MAKYMKDHFPFLGVPSADRRAAVRPIARPADADVLATVDLFWSQEEREFHYVAIELLDTRAKYLDPVVVLDTVEHLARTKSWWDSVDPLAGVAARVFRRNPELLTTVDRWITDPDFWVARLAILHQLGLGPATDEARLFRLCLVRAHEKEFFVRKAIGWALRDYAWTEPRAVEAFVTENEQCLAPLTRREALKNIGHPKAGTVRRKTERSAGPVRSVS